ncbi:MAG: hypothetical protein IJ901_00055 [Bacteroidaceae bacterium]|nr:hypothetical protein [Bacteroidaceae bacterium]
MKKIFLAFTLLLLCVSSNAQYFLRYYMNNNTYNGFYTESIDSLVHRKEQGIMKSITYAYGKEYEITLDAVDSVAIEAALIDEGDVGQYKIYEIDNPDSLYKKIYVDNRAVLFASQKGDFGANDTILLASVYNGVTCLFFTDYAGRILKMFDGTNLFYFDYDVEEGYNVINLTNSGYEVHHIEENQYLYSKQRRVSPKIITSFFKQVSILFAERPEIRSIVQSSIGMLASQMISNLESLQDNPENRYLNIGISLIFTSVDILGFCAACGLEVPSAGLSTAAVVLAAYSLSEDLSNLEHLLFPNEEQMQRYHEYYQKKYKIKLTAMDAENISGTGVTLLGTAHSSDWFRGPLYLVCGPRYAKDMSQHKYISPKIQFVNNEEWNLSAEVWGLEPNTTYEYFIEYRRHIQGLDFQFESNIVEFNTLSSAAEIINFEVLDATYSKDGFEYKGETYSYKFECTTTVELKNAEGVEDWGYVYKDPNGEIERISLKGFECPYPDSRYVYYRKRSRSTATLYGYVKFYNDEKYYDAEPQDYDLIYGKQPTPGKIIDLGLKVKWAAWNIGANSPEEFGNYYAWGETEPKEEYTWQNYKYRGNFTTNMTYRATSFEDLNNGYIQGTRYDVARQEWGQRWMIPSTENVYELTDRCKYEEMQYEGVDGALFTGPNGNSIFIPFTGGYYNNTFDEDLRWYWTAESFERSGISGFECNDAYIFNVMRPSGYITLVLGRRDRGLPVRAVYK